MKPIERFSSRVEHYRLYRPRYPKEVLRILRDENLLHPGAVIADLGSGTGFLAELFLEAGHTVHGVGPNREMREAGEAVLAGYSGFSSVDGSAEHTTLPDDSMDLITAGQAFHWFDVPATKLECQRILRPGGAVSAIWNERRVEDDAFQAEYDLFMREFGTDYDQMSFQHKVVESDFDGFFTASWFVRDCFNEQRLDFAGLQGRLLSTSYIPREGAPRFEEMMAALRVLFDRYQNDGQITLRYRTRVFGGRV